MTHRREPAEPTRIMKPVKPPKIAKASRATTDVSNWWYAVGALVGVAIVAVWWLFLYNPIMSIFY